MKKTLCIISVMIVLLACGETLANSYANLDAARSAGAIQRGWVPDILPNGSTDIHEIHNLDTNVLRGSFRFTPEDGKAFRNSLQPDLRIKSKEVSLEPFGARAHDFKIQETTQSLSMRGYQMFNYRDYCFAVHWDQGHGFYWNCK